jgi:hypothetical protein
MLVGNQTREVNASGVIVDRGVYNWISISVAPNIGAGDVTLLNVSVTDGGGVPYLRHPGEKQ